MWGLAVSSVSTASAATFSIDCTGWRAGLGIISSACFFEVMTVSWAAIEMDTNAAAIDNAM